MDYFRAFSGFLELFSNFFVALGVFFEYLQAFWSFFGSGETSLYSGIEEQKDFLFIFQYIGIRRAPLVTTVKMIRTMDKATVFLFIFFFFSRVREDPTRILYKNDNGLFIF